MEPERAARDFCRPCGRSRTCGLVRKVGHGCRHSGCSDGPSVRSRREKDVSWDIGVATPSAHPAPRGMVRWNRDEILAVGHDVTHGARRSLSVARSTKLPAAPCRSSPSSLSGYGHFRTKADIHGQLPTSTDKDGHTFSPSLALRRNFVLECRAAVCGGCGKGGGAHMTDQGQQADATERAPD